MNYQDFFNTWNGKPCKVLPNSNPPQCFDLAIAWTDNLGVPHFPGNPSPFPYANASQIFTDFGTFQAQYFDRVPNTPTGVPLQGDIVVWSASYNGGAGHVGIASGQGDTNAFQCFEQNDPIGSVSHVKTYSYTDVLGWLHPKSQQPDPLTECLKQHDLLVTQANQKDQLIATLNSQVASLQATVSTQSNDLLTAQANLKVAQDQAAKIPDLQTQINDLTDSRDGYMKDLSSCRTQLNSKPKVYQSRIANFLITLADIFG